MNIRKNNKNKELGSNRSRKTGKVFSGLLVGLLLMSVLTGFVMMSDSTEGVTQSSTIEDASDNVNRAKWSNNGEYLAIGGSDNTLRVYNHGSYDSTEFSTDVDRTIRDILWYSDDDYLLSFDTQNDMEVYDTNDWSLVDTITLDKTPASASLRSGGDYIAVSQKNDVDVELINTTDSDPNNWDLDSASPIYSSSTTDSGLQDCRFSPDGNQLAVGERSDGVGILDTSSSNPSDWSKSYSLNESSDIYHGIEWSPDGDALVVGDNTATEYYIYESSNFPDVEETVDVDVEMTSFSWHPDTDYTNSEGYLVAGEFNSDYRVRVFDISDWSIHETLSDEHTDSLTSVDFRLNGDNISTGSRDETAIVWDSSDLNVDGEQDISITNLADDVVFEENKTELSADVNHPDGKTMDVKFYDAFDDTLIGENNSVTNGTYTQTWDGLLEGATYEWYVVADDNEGNVTESAVQSFEMLKTQSASDSFEDGDYTSDPEWTEDDFSGGSMDVGIYTSYDGDYSVKGTTDGDDDGDTTYLYQDFDSSDLSDGDKFSYWGYADSQIQTTLQLRDTSVDEHGSMGFDDDGSFYYAGSDMSDEWHWGSYSTGNWYRFELVYHTDSFDYYIYDSDGDEVESVTGVDATGGNYDCDRFYFGISDKTSSSEVAYFDDVILPIETSEQIDYINFTKETLKSENDKWNGRTSMIELSDGTWVMSYREAGGHADTTDGVLHLKFSDDYGDTWTDDDTYLNGSSIDSFPNTPPYATTSDDLGPGEPWMYKAPNGDIVLHSWSIDYGDSYNGTWQIRSTDGGQTWSEWSYVDFEGATDDEYIMATDDHFVYDGTIYAGARKTNPSDVNNEWKSILIKSTDNGSTWEKVSDVSNYTWGTGGTIEFGMEYLGNDEIVTVLREENDEKTWYRKSTDMGTTWNDEKLLDIDRGNWIRMRIFTVDHLKGKDDWWEDDRLIGVGATESDGKGTRRNAFFYSNDAGKRWRVSHMDDTDGDGGYGDVKYNPDEDKFVFTSYHGGMQEADLNQYSINDVRGVVTESDNSAPDEPTNPSPSDGETGVSTSPTLEVDVSDPDEDSMNVYFYDAETDDVIDQDTSVSSGSTASIIWDGLDTDTTYEWYAVANDSEDETQSNTWSFTTEGDTSDDYFEVTITNTNEPITEGETLEVDVNIDNTGDTSDTQTLELLDFGGDVVDSTDVTLDGGSSTTGTLEWNTEVGDSGTDDITVQTDDDSDTESVTIDTEELDEPEVETLKASINDDTITLKGNLTSIGNYSSVDVFFKYRENGDENWTETTHESLNEEGKFEYNITNTDKNKSSEYQAVVEFDGDENTGEIVQIDPIYSSINESTKLIKNILPLAIILAVVSLIVKIFGGLKDGIR